MHNDIQFYRTYILIHVNFDLLSETIILFQMKLIIPESQPLETKYLNYSLLFSSYFTSIYILLDRLVIYNKSLEAIDIQQILYFPLATFPLPQSDLNVLHFLVTITLGQVEYLPFCFFLAVKLIVCQLFNTLLENGISPKAWKQVE